MPNFRIEYFWLAKCLVVAERMDWMFRNMSQEEAMILATVGVTLGGCWLLAGESQQEGANASYA